VGATAKPVSALFTDDEAFAERTGMLTDWRELLPLGLEPDSMAGAFDRSRVQVLLDFVKADPVYHIITFVGPDRYVNRFVTGRRTLYFLADGDSGPNLVCNPTLAADWHLVAEDAISETLAVLYDIKNGRQTKG